jgi:outer membrane receptor protein involved in Fe transport
MLISSPAPFKRNFTNWIPNLLIVKKLNENHELKFNYTERIRRPWIMDLNPYSNASDPLNITPEILIWSLNKPEI